MQILWIITAYMNSLCSKFWGWLIVSRSWVQLSVSTHWVRSILMTEGIVDVCISFIFGIIVTRRRHTRYCLLWPLTQWNWKWWHLLFYQKVLRIILPWTWDVITLIEVRFWCDSEVLRVRASNVLLSIVMAWTWLGYHVIRNRIKSFSGATYLILRRLLSDKLIIRIVRSYTRVWLWWSMITMKWVYFWERWS